MSAYSTLLLAIDLSEESEQVAARAGELAKAYGAYVGDGGKTVNRPSPRQAVRKQLRRRPVSTISPRLGTTPDDSGGQQVVHKATSYQAVKDESRAPSTG